jgi:hypothetical protein
MVEDRRTSPDKSCHAQPIYVVLSLENSGNRDRLPRQCRSRSPIHPCHGSFFSLR